MDWKKSAKRAMGKSKKSAALIAIGSGAFDLSYHFFLSPPLLLFFLFFLWLKRAFQLL
jgi:hypothetical protein